MAKICFNTKSLKYCCSVIDNFDLNIFQFNIDFVIFCFFCKHPKVTLVFDVYCTLKHCINRIAQMVMPLTNADGHGTN